MSKTDNLILHITHFSKMIKWSAHDSVSGEIGHHYPLILLSKVLKRVKEPVNIEDDQCYKRITVRLYGKGVLQRDKLQGKYIGTKRQFAAHAGQFIISRIDARNGAFGIVPDSLEGAIVTNDFWVFEVHMALPEYLMLVLSSDLFQKYWQTQSSGTTNRQRINEDDFLHSKIILPSIPEQAALLEKYHTIMGKADRADKMSDKILMGFSKYLKKTLDISYISITKKNVLNLVKFKNLSRWDPVHLSNKVEIKSKYPMTTISKVINNFLIDNDGNSLRRNTKNESEILYQYIGMEDIEKNTGLRNIREVFGNEILSQTFCVPPGYIIYGKLRPYLNKYWVNTMNTKNLICSSEFFVFNTKNINRDYFMAVLTSDIIQKQLPPLYSGARMPRITEKDFLGLQIPLPPEDVQIEIGKRSAKTRTAINDLRNKAEKMRSFARSEFDNAVFR